MRIVESKFIKSAVKPSQYPASAFSDFAFVGKSNVGKSALINTILNRKAIAKVSGTPGKTRLINFFEIRFKNENDEDGFMNFVDLPGYGYAKVSKKERESWQTMILNYFAKRIQLKGVIMLADIRHKADPKDKIMLDMLIQNNIPFIIAATKSDKLAKSKINRIVKKLAVGLQVKNAQIKAVSSLKKTGFEEILAWISQQIS
ncbi:MAG: ribosome biogenesis GTP-binding protein YihA/YsxC [Candidatus Cloacimonetes bacterium]|nr:ribosome biogenesis GTP-binding protein YihA/YsxC [Candidatus Cloacimonadota bacterium]MCF7813961.1 ribosome biogenesis GTP-binding protein YihA/YsxC [Candidatus Cloacimonadota bacterium]MCF7868805.1 ribosome biogenesis GTP-binding protein YihA/YsxC [Candidatus Cloacimonadota bacterium]MCF7884064.1 ribosome biogenesis GTP-binding protein YihA/YsxC [Candidatus Cloacimonadota bacterium]